MLAATLNLRAASPARHGLAVMRLWIETSTDATFCTGDHAGPAQVPRIDRHTFPAGGAVREVGTCSRLGIM